LVINTFNGIYQSAIEVLALAVDLAINQDVPPSATPKSVVRTFSSVPIQLSETESEVFIDP